MKICNKCRIAKETHEFYKDTANKSGLHASCKQCSKASARAYYTNHKQKILEAKKNWRTLNPEIHADRYEAWRIKNKHVKATKQAERRLATSRSLGSAYNELIKREYELASWCSKVMGSIYHVDHIVPLNGKTVCGLHVPWNLRVIPAHQNLSKGNKLL